MYRSPKNIQYLSYRRTTMAGVGKNVWTILLVLVVALALAYVIDPSLGGLLKMNQGFSGSMKQPFSGSMQGFEDEEEREGFANPSGSPPSGASNYQQQPGAGVASNDVANVTGNSHALSGDLHTSASNLGDMEGPANFGSASAPAGCYPRDQLTPGELLPKDQNSVWAEQNPMGPGSLKGKNFLSAGALIGVNTVGQSLRNANYQLRSEPPNPQVPVSIFNQSTIAPDTNRRPLEIN